MDPTEAAPTDTIEVFQQCGACSHTFAYLLNRAFGHPHDEAELALDPLAGGILNQGRQCGMLWGAALAAGAEAFRRCDDPGQAAAAAMATTREIVDSFVRRTGAVNCREFIGIDLSKTFGLLRFIIRTTVQGAKKNPCFRLAEQWAPEAIAAAAAGLAEAPAGKASGVVSCTSEVARRMGASQKEAVLVAGFAGGLGLSGKTCGALSAAIWMNMLTWCREHPGQTPPYFNNPTAKSVLHAFLKATGGEMQCSEIAGRSFQNIEEHAQYLRQGGCRELLEALADA